MATKKTVEVSVLRQRLLQFILEKKFKEYIGGDWWSKNLHPHMQDEAKNLDSKTGIAYGIVLRKYKQNISFDKLDTSSLCNIALFDKYYQEGKYALMLDRYEITLFRTLHRLRNDASHEESDDMSKQTIGQMLSILRDAIDQYDLTNTNPHLAQDILEAYLANKGEAGNMEDLYEAMRQTGEYEKAEKASQWRFEEAFEIFKKLADENYIPAIRRMMYTYCFHEKYLDLEAAVQMAQKLVSLNDMDELECRRLEGLKNTIPYAIMGVPDAYDTVLAAMAPDGIFLDRKLQRYLTRMNEVFPDGLITLGVATYHKEIHEKDYKERNARKEQGDPEAYAEIAFRMAMERRPLVQLYNCLKPAVKQKSPRGEFLNILVESAFAGTLNFQELLQKLTQLGERGYLPVVDAFAAHIQEGPDSVEYSASRQWVRVGVYYGSDFCKQLSERYGVDQNSNATIQRQQEEEREDLAEDQSREGEEADPLEKLTLENESLKKTVRLMAFAIIVLFAMLIAK